MYKYICMHIFFGEYKLALIHALWKLMGVTTRAKKYSTCG